MESDAKRWHVGAAIDRISNLPRNLIDNILECLPVHDAARTSVLSKTWKSIWVNHPQLVFDEKFLSQLAPRMSKRAKLHTVTKTISTVLLLHTGPIVKFHLFIPEDLPLNQCQDLDIWIKHVSNNRVRKLELFNKLPVAYKLPSNLFSCLELTNLTLYKCILHPPLRFGGFRNLKSANLLYVTITADMSFGTQLEELVLEQCIGLQHLGCQFKWNNSLTTLKIFDCRGINLQWFECTKNVQNFGLMLSEGLNSIQEFISINNLYFKKKKKISINNLFGNMPKICCLQLDGYFFKVLKPVAANLKMENLKSLHLYCISLDDLADMRCVLCLLKISPNLRYLHIKLETGWLKMLDYGIEYMQSQDLSGLILDQLETVKIAGIMHYKTELYFIKFLLASSPSLKWMKLVTEERINDLEEVYRISRELMRFPRASPAAQIIWT